MKSLLRLRFGKRGGVTNRPTTPHENRRCHPRWASSCRSQIADYKTPSVVEFVAGIPKNPTGKILKRVLQEAERQRNGSDAVPGEPAPIAAAATSSRLLVPDEAGGEIAASILAGYGALVLAQPTAQGLRRAAHLARNRADRRPLAGMLLRVLENHPNCPLTYFRWVTLLFVHDPILSKKGVSGKPGAVQKCDKVVG